MRGSWPSRVRGTPRRRADERRRIEGELHDSAQNRLIALKVRLSLAQEKTEQTAPEVAAALAGFVREAEGVDEELRRIAHGISPPTLATQGLVGALRAECEVSALAVQIAADDVERSAPEVESAVYLCCLEAVQNAASTPAAMPP